MKKSIALILACVMLFSFASCKGNKKPNPNPKTLDLRTVSIDEITKKAKKEGRLETVGMPDTWANWKASWEGLNKKYGIQHADVDMSSGEEIALFTAEKDDPTKDLGDVGQAFAPTAVAEGVVQPYKVSCWDKIPDWAKDPDGNWACSYYGTNCFIYNDKLTKGECPTTWKELLASNIRVCPGDPVIGASCQIAVVACAIAMGGSLDNVQPGIDYFKQLAKQGRLDPTPILKDSMLSGESECIVGHFDFNGTAWATEINSKNIKNVHITATIPQDGAISTGYAQIINKYAPHPYTAALTLEYLFSEQGQIDRAYGGARPIRSDVKLPDDVPLLPESLYQHVTNSTDIKKLQTACDAVARLWQEEIIPLIG